MHLDEIDLLDAERFEQSVPHEWFTWLRHHAPIYKHREPNNGPGFWVITRYDDVVQVNRDGVTFSSEQSRGGVVAMEDAAAAADLSAQGRMMLTMDAPDHTRYRSLVNRGFTPRMINALGGRIREMVIKILEPALEKRDCDFVVEVASELPLQVIAEMLGVPFEDRHKLFEWSNRMIGSKDPEYAVSEQMAQHAAIEMYMYSNELAKQRREDPRDDIVTTLLKPDANGDSLSEMDFNVFFLLLAVAGNETTRNALSHGVHALIDHPAQYRKLVENPSLVTSATEEVLRWASPVMYFRRNVTKDTEVRGQQIKAGDKVGIWYISANRDEEIFENPFTFDIARSPNEHVAFGGGGPHFCLGASLARMEISILLEELAKRVGAIEQIGEVKRLRSNFINGIKHLPVRLTPSRRDASH
ncbi:MAG: cytochrome P450 [Candidatus Binatus sp.]|uniref:cytochrome P450 n=1 Tax=Candidatus Binatus sp. TaxID=2811406 RepID=UPI002720D2E0|nr:cytochrome P450 [Candidatus Binatus sp.]MDO8432600.1 cytochrome P450 [Candidatus Binatus sp.]